MAGLDLNLESRLLGLQADLRSQAYAPGQYHNFYICEPKQRLVSAAPFCDRVVHKALYTYTEAMPYGKVETAFFTCSRTVPP